MTHPGIALQVAIYQNLIASNSLLAKLGGENVYDDVPPKKKPPYVIFANSVHRDWSTGSESGMEHEINLHVWSRENGRKEALELAGEIVDVLDNIPNTLDGHQLINFTHEFTEVRKDEDSEFFLAELNFRAVTEPV